MRTGLFLHYSFWLEFSPYYTREQNSGPRGRGICHESVAQFWNYVGEKPELATFWSLCNAHGFRVPLGFSSEKYFDKRRMEMSLRKITVVLAVVAFLFAVARTGKAHAQTRTECAPSGFENCSLDGGYGFAFTGLVAVKTNIDRIDDYNPLAAAGVWNFHGDGTFDAADTLTINGSVNNRHYSGTYSINPDGTGTAQFTSLGLTHVRDLVIVDQGKRVEFIQTDVGNVVQGAMFKQ
jgi:hypothetical protein